MKILEERKVLFNATLPFRNVTKVLPAAPQHSNQQPAQKKGHSVVVWA